MQRTIPSDLFHADDYGITTDQAREILTLSTACGGFGVLNSVSIFTNSSAFEEAAELARGHVERGRLLIGLHLNLVEGHPLSAPDAVPLLVGSRYTFSHDFLRLLAASRGPHREALRAQLVTECRAQIARFLTAFPEMREHLRIDSHQHTHAIPIVFDALSRALDAEHCTVEHLRAPVEPLGPHKTIGTDITAANHAKVWLLSCLWQHCDRSRIPAADQAPLFCGVALSAHMDQVTSNLVDAFRKEAGERSCEFLFHPVRVPEDTCLDPENAPFTAACASSERDLEAEALRRLESELNARA